MNNDDITEILKQYLKKVTQIIGIIGIVCLVAVCVWYLICYKESILTRLTKMKYSETVTISPTEGIKSTIEHEKKEYNSELLQFFSDNGYDLEKYFNDKDEEKNLANLEYILNAELVTQFPYIEGLSADKVNGVIRFKRISTDGNENQEDYSEDNNNISETLKDCLVYVSNEEFYKWIDEYNAYNSKNELKEKAMNSFTITGDSNQIVEVAILKEAKVVTNDELKDEDTIRRELDETFQNASFVVTNDENTGNRIYTFQILSTIQIEYKKFIEEYTMPSDFLFNLLTYSEDLEFVLDIAKLAYQSTIIVGIYDSNSSIVSYSKEYNYNRQMKLETNIETYVPAVLSGYYLEEEAVTNNFATFENNVLSRYPNINNAISDEKYLDFYSFYTDNIYDKSDVYYYGMTHVYEYLTDETGENSALTTEPKEYHLNYYFYENIPKYDINIADIWYGYYSKNYYYNEPEIQESESELNPTQYIQIKNISEEDDNLKESIINLFTISIDEYVNTGIFDPPAFSYHEFNYDGPAITEDMTDEEKQVIQNEIERQRAEYILAKEAAYSQYLKNIRDIRITQKSILEEQLDSTSVWQISTVYVRDTRITKKISTNNLGEQQMFYYTELAAENIHFSKILQNHQKAYNSFNDIGYWLIEALEKTESTKNVVQKVKYLLNKAYDTESFGQVTDEELLKLYTTVSINIPTSGNFLEIAQACHDYLRLNNYYYSSEANINAGNYIQDGPSQGRDMPVILGESQNERYIDCSAYVTWVLMQTGHIAATNTTQYSSYMLYANSLGFATMTVSKIEDLTDEDLNANGYILVKNGHTEIYAGKDENGYYYTYNAGSTSSIRKEISKYTQEQFYSHFNSDYKVLIVGEV